MVAVQGVVDGGEHPAVVVDRQVADPVHNGQVVRDAEGPGLEAVPLPSVLVAGVSAHIHGNDLGQQHLRHPEVVHGIHIVAGVDEAIVFRMQPHERPELVHVV